MLFTKLRKVLINFGTISGVVFYLLLTFTSYDDVFERTISSTSTNILLCSIILALLLVTVLSQRSLVHFNFIDIVFGTLFIYSIFRLYNGFTMEYAVYNARWSLLYASAYILGRNIKDEKEKLFFFIIIYSVTLSEAIISLGQFDISEFIKNGLYSINIHNIKGNFSNSSMLAFLMSTGILIGISYLKKTVSNIKKIGIVITMLLFVITLILTTSRAALLMLLLGVLILFRVKWKYLALVGIAFMIIFFTYKKESITGRILVWKVSTKIISDNPLLGVGTNRFGAIYNNYQGKYFEGNDINKKDEWVAGNNYFAFNLPLKIIIEYGILGFLLFCLALTYLFLKISKNLLLVSLFIGYIAFSLFSYPLDQIEPSYLFFVIIGIGASSHRDNCYYKIPLNFSKILKITLSVLLLFTLTKELHTLNSLKKWERKKRLIENSPQEYIQLLNKLNSSLKGFPEFLFHYGATLVANGHKEGALDKFILCSYRIPSSHAYIYLAICYEEKNNKIKALRNYRFATKIAPNLFVPKYYLFLHYKKIGNNSLAKQVAQEIIQQPVKTNNIKVTRIKEIARSFIENN